ncbi:hypothetical protein [Helicobacter pylori]|uniref:hypothetical protein n=1 Tax=Helicobacter pylori TaxID=210 RepID=UPI0039DFBD15
MLDTVKDTLKLESCFRDTIKHPFYCSFTIGNYWKLFMGIFYCENANTHKIELIGNDSDFRGEKDSQNKRASE